MKLTIYLFFTSLQWWNIGDYFTVGLLLEVTKDCCLFLSTGI